MAASDTLALPTVTAPEPGGGAGYRAEHHARRWWILSALSLAQLMVILDATVVNIALPSAQRSLGFSIADRQWIVTAYSLAFGSLLLLGGRLSDLLGRKRVLVIGMIGFAAASALGGAATGFGMLVVARAIQGGFGALLAPAALSVLTVTFVDPAERGKAFGIYGAIAGAGGAIGLVLGGVLTQYLDWRWCLYVNVIFGVVALLATLVFIPRTDGTGGAHLDWPGTVSVVLGLTGIVYGFSSAETRSWGNPVTVVSLILGVVLLALFVQLERRVGHPLLPLRVLADRFRGTANLAILISGIGIFGVFLFLTYYIQQVLEFSPVMSGVSFLPMVGGLMVTSTVATARLLPRYGPRWLVSGGMVTAAGGLVWLAQLSPTSSYGTTIVPALIIMGLGLGFVFGAAMNVATAGTAHEDAGVASALPNIGQQVGGSVGTALLNTLAASAAASYLVVHGSSQVAQTASAVHGDDVAFWLAAAVFAVGAVVSGVLFRSGPAPVEAVDEAGIGPVAPAL